MKKFAKAFGVILLAAVFAAGGYMAGIRTQQSSIASAVPHISFEKHEEERATETPDEKPKEEPNQEAPATPPEKSSVDVRIISKSEKSAAESGWSQLEKTQNPEGAGTVTLYTSAIKDGDEIVWDDSQQWLLEYSDGNGGYYPLLTKYISNGSLYYDVFQSDKGDWLINAYAMTGAGTTITQYSLGENGFEEKTVYDSGAVNKIMSTVPNYK